MTFDEEFLNSQNEKEVLKNKTKILQSVLQTLDIVVLIIILNRSLCSSNWSLLWNSKWD